MHWNHTDESHDKYSYSSIPAATRQRFMFYLLHLGSSVSLKTSAENAKISQTNELLNADAVWGAIITQKLRINTL